MSKKKNKDKNLVFIIVVVLIISVIIITIEYSENIMKISSTHCIIQTAPIRRNLNT